MTLKSYLKKDIDTFLEEMDKPGNKKNSVREEEFSLFTVERDYAEETRNAFDKFDTNTIEKILKDLQTQANNKLLEDDLHEKISSVLNEVEEIIIKRVNEVHSPALTAEAEKIIAKRKKEIVTKQKKEELFNKSIHAITNYLAKKEISQAKLAYQRLVKDFKRNSQGPDFELWRKKIFSVFESIKEVDARILKEKDYLIEKKKEKINVIKQKISQVIQGLGSMEVHVLENKLVEIKQDIISAKLSKEEGEAFLPILRSLVSKINFLKQAEEKERLLEQKKAEEEKKELEMKKAEEEKKELEMKKVDEKTKVYENQKKDTVIKEKLDEVKIDKILPLSQEELDEYREALSLQNKGELEKAKELYEKLLQKNPNNIRATIRLEEIKNKKMRLHHD